MLFNGLFGVFSWICKVMLVPWKAPGALPLAFQRILEDDSLSRGANSSGQPLTTFFWEYMSLF